MLFQSEGGLFQNLGNTKAMQCHIMFFFSFCTEKDGDTCREPCQNGGICVKDEELGYTCECVDGWSGMACQSPPTNTNALIVVLLLFFLALILAIAARIAFVRRKMKMDELNKSRADRLRASESQAQRREDQDDQVVRQDDQDGHVVRQNDQDGQVVRQDNQDDQVVRQDDQDGQVFRQDGQDGQEVRQDDQDGQGVRQDD